MPDDEAIEHLRRQPGKPHRAANEAAGAPLACRDNRDGGSGAPINKRAHACLTGIRACRGASAAGSAKGGRMPAGLRLRADFQRFVGTLEIGSESLHVHHPQQDAAEAFALDQTRAAMFGFKQEVMLAIEQSGKAEPPQPTRSWHLRCCADGSALTKPNRGCLPPEGSQALAGAAACSLCCPGCGQEAAMMPLRVEVHTPPGKHRRASTRPFHRAVAVVMVAAPSAQARPGMVQ